MIGTAVVVAATLIEVVCNDGTAIAIETDVIAGGVIGLLGMLDVGVAGCGVPGAGDGVVGGTIRGDSGGC